MVLVDILFWLIMQGFFLHFPILLTDDCSTEITVKFIVVLGNFDNLCNLRKLTILGFYLYYICYQYEELAKCNRPNGNHTV
jgi:hypothetical protein